MEPTLTALCNPYTVFLSIMCALRQGNPRIVGRSTICLLRWGNQAYCKQLAVHFVLWDNPRIQVTLECVKILCNNHELPLQRSVVSNPWIVLYPHSAHFVGGIQGLRNQSTDCCAKRKSTVCAGQSADCPNPYFAHNIYIIYTPLQRVNIRCYVLSSISVIASS